MADIFDVIADGTRRDILQLLRERGNGRGTSVSQIVAELGVSQPTVSKHLKVLREAELVSVREEGQHRYYSLSPAPLDAVDEWLMPFVLEEESSATAGVTLPEPAAAAADLVGRAAATTKHAFENVLKRIPGR
ncbi:ArsR/SmtB family transcription factor [Microbacterium sp. T2.11-28]|uniref:ArsR/SmtB family transcription factor n=1 Tax=unclassified Microbacterium TaxID=2609290 RepID=UPI00247742ED|nr:metalloregulator ArsR/SmtB family transcription factor [Microbacterium sp. T2.11-28]CAI9393559.1 hypothetical protein MICABA_02488 [Microbacterium sp. T2.11-28]